MELVPCST